MYHAATKMASEYNNRYAQPGSVDIAAAAEPDFGGQTQDIQAAGVLSFTSGTTTNVKVLEPFLVLGNTVVPGTSDKPTVVELPADDARYVVSLGKAAVATEDEVAAAQKAAAKTK